MANTAETWMVAHDFSSFSDLAAQEAARLLAPHGGTLRLFHIHAPLNLPAEQAWGEETYALEKELQAQLGTVAERLKAKYPSLNIEVSVGTGEPVGGILTEAGRCGVDHIVVGTHGRTGLAHVLLGSVAERVVREAKVPVLVVRANPGEKPR
jgi:nucleotide-binding universal stress UspA family protein